MFQRRFKKLIATHKAKEVETRNILGAKETAHEELRARVVSIESQKANMEITIEELDADNKHNGIE